MSSMLDSTIETDKGKDAIEKKTINLNVEKEIKVESFQENLEKEPHLLFNYLPSDISLFHKIYKVDDKIIYKNGLSPSIIHTGEEVSSGLRVAIKELRKEKLKDKEMHEMTKNEFTFHHLLSQVSSNVVKVKNYFEDDKAYYLVMEFSEEPDFFEDLLENRYCPVSDERTLKAFAFDILTGLKEIHKFNIIHCDIKPQNFLLFKSEGLDGHSLSEDEDYLEDFFLKITDFGFAHKIPEGEDKVFLKQPLGTFAYIAPEITKNCYVNKSIDIWSFGVSLYQMAVAYFPTAIKQYKYGKGPIPFRAVDWKGYDFEKIKDLIEKCLQIEPNKRISALEALNHPWFDE